MKRALRAHGCQIDVAGKDLRALRDLLQEKRRFMLGMLENPNLLEHDRFTELLLAVFHLTEELIHRSDLTHLTPADVRHIEGDIKRAYDLIIREWADYMHHMKENYPYLFSLAIRLNPFDPEARPEIP